MNLSSLAHLDLWRSPHSLTQCTSVNVVEEETFTYSRTWNIFKLKSPTVVAVALTLPWWVAFLSRSYDGEAERGRAIVPCVGTFWISCCTKENWQETATVRSGWFCTWFSFLLFPWGYGSFESSQCYRKKVQGSTGTHNTLVKTKFRIRKTDALAAAELSCSCELCNFAVVRLRSACDRGMCKEFYI